jgi:hypothetical protein
MKSSSPSKLVLVLALLKKIDTRLPYPKVSFGIEIILKIVK